jgi:hypothetical protein
MIRLLIEFDESVLFRALKKCNEQKIALDSFLHELMCDNLANDVTVQNLL